MHSHFLFPDTHPNSFSRRILPQEEWVFELAWNMQVFCTSHAHTHTLTLTHSLTHSHIHTHTHTHIHTHTHTHTHTYTHTHLICLQYYTASSSVDML